MFYKSAIEITSTQKLSAEMELASVPVAPCEGSYHGVLTTSLHVLGCRIQGSFQ